MSSIWDDFYPPAWVDPDAFLFMGPDPSWTPDKEEKQSGCEDIAPNRCHLCGGSQGEYLKDQWGNVLWDPRSKLPAIGLAPQIEKGSHGVCARCMRYGRPWELLKRPNKTTRRERKAGDETKPAPKPEPKVVEKIVVGRGTITVPERFAKLLSD